MFYQKILHIFLYINGPILQFEIVLMKYWTNLLYTLKTRSSIKTVSLFPSITDYLCFCMYQDPLTYRNKMFYYNCTKMIKFWFTRLYNNKKHAKESFNHFTLCTWTRFIKNVYLVQLFLKILRKYQNDVINIILYDFQGIQS